ncbi:hypothetical protein TUM12147_05770 [Citrobacter europaeus]|nr:hypothetical protein TUM12147_05770 [Citrobacter europaeus]GIZ22021.1 hypothetical protein TUM12148_06850 [Citrobacter europaeus]
MSNADIFCRVAATPYPAYKMRPDKRIAIRQSYKSYTVTTGTRSAREHINS